MDGIELTDQSPHLRVAGYQSHSDVRLLDSRARQLTDVGLMPC